MALAEIKVIRDEARARVRVAHQLGIKKAEIYELSGLARSTVDRYLGHKPKDGRPGVSGLPPADAGPVPRRLGPG